MFYTIRRVLKFCVLLFFIGVGVVVYQNRHIFEPVAIWYEVWENNGFKTSNPLPTISGTASVVLDSRSFHLARPKMAPFAIRLAGLNEPNLTPTSVQAAKDEAEGKRVLRELIQGKTVNVDITYNNNNSGLGICYVSDTNINLHLIREGHAVLKPEYIKPLPPKIQYQFFHARRLAKQKSPQELPL